MNLLKEVLLFAASLLAPIILNWLLSILPGSPPLTEPGLLNWLIYLINWSFGGTRLYKVYLTNLVKKDVKRFYAKFGV